MGGSTVVPVPDDLRDAARQFLKALDRLWNDRTGQDLANATFAKLAKVRPATVQRIRTLQAAPTPTHLRRLLGADSTEDLTPLCRSYVTAYGDLYPDDAALAWVRQIAESTGAPAERPNAIEHLERATALAMQDANRLIDTRSAELSLEDLYVPRRFTGSREVRTEEDLATRCGTMSVTVIVGEPGTGKTSVLWRLAKTLRKDRTAWLVPAGAIEAGVPVADIGWALHARSSAAVPPVLLVDTVDLLLRSDEMAPAIDELIQACSAAGAALVMTCRPREYDVLHRAADRRYAMERLGLGPYSDAELPAAIGTHAEHFIDGLRFDPLAIARAVLTAVARGLPVAQICRVPLTLRMLFELHQLEHPGDEPLETEIDVTDLFDKYWQLRVRTDARTNRTGSGPDDDLTAAAEWLAVLMLAAGRPRIDNASATRALERLHGLLDGLDILVRRSVVHEVGDGRREFFHQTFFEYTVARAIVALGAPAIGALVDRTIARPDDAFLGAVTQQTLVYACRTDLDADVADLAFATLLGCAHSGVQQVAIAAYAQARCRGQQTTGAGRRLLAEGGKGLARRYLVFVSRVRHDDVRPILDDLALAWRHDSDHVHAEVFGALRALAAVRRDAIYEVVSAEDSEYLRWYLGLDPDVARERRRPVLDLMAELAPADPGWCADRLEEVAQLAARDGAQDGLAAVLVVAAESRLPTDRLRGLLAVIPGDVKSDPSGANELGLVAAGLVRQIWAAEGADPIAVAEDLAADTSTPASLGSGHGWSPPDWLALPSRLRALAELACQEAPAIADRLITTLLTAADRQTRTRIGSYFLKHLLDGKERYRLPGGPDPVETPATKAARQRCIKALQSTTPARSATRSEKVLWREALYSGRLPPVEVADIVSEATRGDPDPGWLEGDRLAMLVVPAALGGHPGARNALTRWSNRRAAGPDDKQLRTIIMPRLEHLAADAPDAFDYLVAEARATSDGSFVDGAVIKARHRRRPLPEGFAERVGPLVRQLLASRIPATRRHGFAIAASVGHGRGVESHAILDGLRIRDTHALTAVLNVVGASLVHDADRWSVRADYAGLDRALAELAVAGAAPNATLGRRAYEYRAMLPCHSGPIATAADRAATLRRVRELVLDPDDPALLEPLGRLLSRLAATDPDDAATLLIDTAAAIERIEVTDSTGAWKSHKVFQLRHAIRNVMVALPYGTWKRTIDALAHQDVRVFTAAIEVSVRERPEEAAAHIRTLLKNLRLEDERVQAMLRAATTRKQRITGSISTWPELLDLWRAAVAHPTGTRATTR